MKKIFLILMQVLLFTAASTAQTTKVIYTCPMHSEVQMSKPGSCPKCGMTLFKKTIKVNTPKKTTSKTLAKPPATKKPETTTKATTSSNEMQTAVKEMKDISKEMKSTVTEMKGLVQQMKGNADETDEEATEEHNHDEMDTDNADTTKPETKVTYTCPMHPEVQSDKPGKCPKCGMTLIRKTVTVNQPNRQTNTQPTQTKVVYTCVMHPEVQQDKPGNCPKCGMTLIKKTVPVSKPTSSNTNNQKNQQGATALADKMVGSKVNLQTGKTVVYHLYVRDTTVNFTGKNKRAISINGSFPGPTLTFTEGDTAEIYLHNQLKEETSLHWHGIILPNRFDGVPYLTTKPIHPGDTYVYKFKVVQNGTYWYHSHSALQEQVGMYGALILKKREDTEMNHTASTNTTDHSNMDMFNHSMPIASNNNTSLKHYNVVLSEWADENPMQTQRRLRTANDWFAIKKGSTQSYSEAIKEGQLKTKLVNEWKRMKAMDVSDDWYQKFLINGKPETDEQQFKAGDKVRLHVVNAGASSYFWLTFGGGKISVVGNDGNEVMPVSVDSLIIAPAETYDIEVTIP